MPVQTVAEIVATRRPKHIVDVWTLQQFLEPGRAAFRLVGENHVAVVQSRQATPWESLLHRLAELQLERVELPVVCFEVVGPAAIAGIGEIAQERPGAATGCCIGNCGRRESDGGIVPRFPERGVRAVLLRQVTAEGLRHPLAGIRHGVAAKRHAVERSAISVVHA